jgi:indole-3-glycerol phosphate synthase
MAPPRRLGSFGEVFDVIAEIKPRSPAEGELGYDGLMDRLIEYERGGAAMISVLTEPDAFSGSLELLSDAAGQASVPVLRKDFLVDPYQVFEARAAGADGVLLIVRMLDHEALAAMLTAVADTGMFAIVEAFDQRDLVRAIGALAVGGNLLVGVNGRDLTTLEVDRSIHAELAKSVTAGRPAVAESGLLREDDIRAVAGLGYRAALVGSALMRANDPRHAVEAMVAAGRETIGAGAV